MCAPSPCGPYSNCRDINKQAVCSCISGFVGSPPNCRPECVISSDCPKNQACVNQRCKDPCPGTCGINALCQVVNHNPICSCPSSFTGDPFIRCLKIESKYCNNVEFIVLRLTKKQLLNENHFVEPADEEKIDPCRPSPCGPYSQCRVVQNNPSCSCLVPYVGVPPHCKPECVSNSECASNLACIEQKCKDPCPGSCGSNAICRVVSHAPICQCVPGYTGDPFLFCSEIPQRPPTEKQEPCDPSPCGPNAVCRERNGAGSCSCIEDYIGNPYQGCRPECVLSTDCSSNKACIRNKCQDPCPGTCGPNADCQVINHLPACTCRPGYSGDPFRFCNIVTSERKTFCTFNGRSVQRFNGHIFFTATVQSEPLNPCSPSPCGPNSQCRESNGQAVCSCLSNFVGVPPGCRPECTSSFECPLNKACSNQKCLDPCPGVCGLDAQCRVVNHNPICSCLSGYTGDPFFRCRPVPRK